MIRNYITFGGRNLKDFGVYISGSGTFNAPERDRKTVAIPGRNGDLTLDNGRYKNITVKYPAGIVDNFSTNMEALRDYLLSFSGYARLEDTYHPEEYRMARYSGGITVKPVNSLIAGQFDLAFDCMPQRFLKSGEDYITVTDGSVVLNPTMMQALPLLEVTANNTSAWVKIGDNKVSIARQGLIYIDCQMQEAYDGTLNLNSYITLNNGVFPYLEAGENTITLNNCWVNIMPRWWRL